MHTTPDYTTKNAHQDAPPLWLIHNYDFSGEVFVCWKIKDINYEWKVPDGKDLLTGNIIGTSLDDNTMAPVPAWVIARAVQVAVRTTLLRKIVTFVEDL